MRRYKYCTSLSKLLAEVNRSGDSIIMISIYPDSMFAFQGLVHAGFDAPAKETMQEILSLENFLVPHPSRTFLMKVKGDSMKLAGIFDGDYILIERGRDVFDGNIIVAVHGGGKTVKTFVQRGEKAFLRSAEEVPREREITKNTKIIGVVVCVLRKYFKN